MAAGVFFLISLVAAVPVLRAADCEEYDLLEDREVPEGMYVSQHGVAQNVSGTYTRVSNTTFKRTEPSLMMLVYVGDVWEFKNGTNHGPESDPCDNTGSCKWPHIANWTFAELQMRPLFGLAWKPPVSTLAGQTCAVVSVGSKLSVALTQELAGGLALATGMKELSLDFTSALGLNMSALDKVAAQMRGLPIENFTLRAGEREAWPTEASATFAKGVPSATGVELVMNAMADSKSLDQAVSSFAAALPSQIKTLTLALQTDSLGAGLAQTLVGAFGAKSRFKKLSTISIDVSEANAGSDLMNQDKLSVFKSLQDRGYERCQLKCDKVTDMTNVTANDESLAKSMCAGLWNCNNPNVVHGAKMRWFVPCLFAALTAVALAWVCTTLRRRRQRMRQALLQPPGQQRRTTLGENIEIG